MLTLLCLLASLAHAETKSVTIYSDFGTPGYTAIDEHGKKTGFEVELAEAVFASQGYRVDWQQKSWDDLAADLKRPSGDKNYAYLASLEGTPERRANWLFAEAVEFEASHYFFARPGIKVTTGPVVDTQTGRTVPSFVLDTAVNRVHGQKLRVAAWKGSVLELELRRVFANAQNVAVLGLSGNPVDWLRQNQTDLVYAFASGPKNSIVSAGFPIVAGPIHNFDADRFGGTSPALPLNSFGQEMNRVWSAGFAALIRGNAFFEISMRWFGRVSWPADYNAFLVQDPAAFQKRISAFERAHR